MHSFVPTSIHSKEYLCQELEEAFDLFAACKLGVLLVRRLNSACSFSTQRAGPGSKDSD